MRKIVMIALPFEVDEPYENWDNKTWLSAFTDNLAPLDPFEGLIAFDKVIVPFDVIAVFDESEKADADSTGETNGPTGLYEVPC